MDRKSVSGGWGWSDEWKEGGLGVWVEVGNMSREGSGA